MTTDVDNVIIGKFLYQQDQRQAGSSLWGSKLAPCSNIQISRERRCGPTDLCRTNRLLGIKVFGLSMTWHDMQQSVGDDKHSFVCRVRRLLALHQTLHRLGREATVAHHISWPERTRTDSSVR